MSFGDTLRPIYLPMVLLYFLPTYTAGQTFTDIDAGLTGISSGTSAWGDYDADGDLDIVVSGDQNGAGGYITSIYNNNGGNFSNISAGLVGVSGGSLDWGDYDNDGDLDLLLNGSTAGSGGITKVYRNTGSGFTDINAGLPNAAGAAAWGDYDNDGDLDIVVTGLISSPTTYLARIYRNDSGSFVDINATSLRGLSYSSVDWGDFDSDGDLDLLIAGEWYIDPNFYLSAIIYRNTGGSFSTAFNLDGVKYGAVEWGDYNSDGKLDVLLVGMPSSGTRLSKVYRNDNTQFTDISASIVPLRYADATWGDSNNDGSLDILVSGDGIVSDVGTRVTKVYHGTSFPDAGVSLQPADNASVSWGDYDNDGDLDVFNSGYNTSIGRFSRISSNGTATANTAPNFPGSLSSTTSRDTAFLAWEASTDSETSSSGLTYNIYLGSVAQGTDIVSPHSSISTGLRLIPAIGNANHNTSWTIAGLTEDTYYWSVQAIDAGFLGSSFATEQSFTIDIPPSPPLNLTATPGYQQVTLWWRTNPETDVHKYNIYRDISPPSTTLVDSVVGLPPDTTYTDTGLTNRQVYYYRISAVDTAGNESDLSDEVSATPYGGPVWYVAIDGSDSTGSGSIEYPFATVQRGIQAANDGDTILVAAGTYNEDGLVIEGKDLHIISFDGPENTIIRPAGSGLFQLRYLTNATIKGFTLEKLTQGSQNGQAVFIYDAQNLVLEDLIITGFLDGTAGCALYIDDSSPLVRNLVISSNSTTHPVGGVVYIEGTTSQPTFENCTLTNNTTTEKGLITLEGSNIHVINSILWGNSDPLVYFNPPSAGPSSALFTYTDLEGGPTSIVTNSNGTLNWLDGNISSVPLFSDSISGDYHLNDDSPCIGVGVDSIEIDGTWYYAPVIDIEGNPRPNPFGSFPDMGAYESARANPFTPPQQPVNLTVIPGDQQVTLVWSPNTEVDLAKYHIYRDTSSPAATLIDSVVGSPPDTTYIDMGLINGVTYYYRISALDNSGNESGFSNEASALPYGGPVWYVSTTGSDTTGNGSFLLPFRSIQHAIDQSIDDDTIRIHTGLYNENLVLLDKQLMIATLSDLSDVTIDGTNSGITIRIDSSSTVILEYLRITNGQAWLEGGLLSVGGGLAVYESNVTIRHSTITDCQASYGGGIGLRNSSINIESCELTGNTAVWQGGGLALYYSSATVDSTIIVDNEVTYIHGTARGGGLYSGFSSFIINRTLIARNQAYHAGGVAWGNSDSGTLYNCTVTGNQAIDTGGAFYVSNAITANIYNTIVWGNFAPTQNEYTRYMLDAYYSIVPWPEQEANSYQDPLFSNPANDDYTLRSDSPAIDAGDPDLDNDSITWQTDADDQDPDGTRLDIGAFYFNQTSLDTSPPGIPLNLTGIPGDQQIVLKWSRNIEPDLVKYNIYRDTTASATTLVSSVLGSPPDSFYTDIGLCNGTSYYYRITAVDSAGNESGHSSEVSGTPFGIVSTYPAIHSVNVPLDAAITITFDVEMEGTSINANTMCVWGNYSGRIIGTYSTVGATVTFTPSTQFKVGEKIHVSLTTGIQTLMGVTVSKPYVWSFSVEGSGGSGIFSDHVTHSVGDEPSTVATADLDRDGDIDIVTTSPWDDNVSVLMNEGDTTYSADVTYAAGRWPKDCAVADLNNDGYCDLIATNTGGFNTLSRLTNNGDGTFSDRIASISGDGPISIVVADLDGDGDLDLATANLDGDNLSVHMNNGDGSISDPVMYATGNAPMAIVVADLDGDRDLDLATANRDDDNLSLFLNNGNGSFSSQATYAAGNAPCSIIAADLDVDGDLDLVTANRYSYDLSVLLNNGDGTYATQVLYAVGTEPYSVAAGDFNSDGYLDLAAANRGSTDASVLRNKGDGTYRNHVTYTVGDGPESIDFADLNGDGALDLVTANATSDNVSVLLNIKIISPAAPTMLTTTPGDQQISLSWSANTEDDIAKYNIYRSTSSPAATLIDSVVGSPPDTIYTDTSVVNDQVYYYRISAVDTAGNESEFSIEVSSIPRSPMAGTYYIDKSGSGDFNSFTAAVTELQARGISSSVVFLATPGGDGIYNEQITIHSISGASDTAPVEFRSETGNAADVVLTYAASNAQQNHVIQIIDASNITLKMLTLRATGATYARIIDIKGYSNNIKIADNIMSSVSVTSGGADDRAHIWAPGILGDSLSVIDNTLNYGSIGIYSDTFRDSTYGNGFQISGNNFQNQYHGAIELAYLNAPQITGNSINTASSYSGYGGITARFCSNDLQIDRNHVITAGEQRGIFLYDCMSTDNKPGLIINNAISMGGAGTAYGIDLENCEHQNICYNSVDIYSTSIEGGRALWIHGVGSTIDIMNNIFVNRGAGYAYYISDTSAVGLSDYNDIYTTGTNFAYWMGEEKGSNLDILRLNSGMEIHSISADPQFADVADDNYHLLDSSPVIGKGRATGIAIADTTDLEGKVRPLPAGSNPDLGAYENTRAIPLDIIPPDIVSIYSGSGFEAEEYELFEITASAEDNVDVDSMWAVFNSPLVTDEPFDGTSTNGFYAGSIIIPAGVTDSAYVVVYASDSVGNIGFEQSDFFPVRDNTAPEIQYLNIPTDLDIGSISMLRVRADDNVGLTSFDWAYQITAGGDWISIEAGATDTVYNWLIPNTPTDQLTLRLIAWDAVGLSDTAYAAGHRIIIAYPTLLFAPDPAIPLNWINSILHFSFSHLLDTSSVADTNILVNTLQTASAIYQLEKSDEMTEFDIVFTRPFASYDSVRILIPSGKVTSYFGYQLDGNANGIPEGSPADDIVRNYAVLPYGDFDSTFTIDFDDLTRFVSGWYAQDYLFELGPSSGTVPHLLMEPDGDFTGRDLITFIRMWDWYSTYASPLAKIIDDSPPLLPEVSYNKGELLIDVGKQDNLGSMHIQITHPTGLVHLGDANPDSTMYSLNLLRTWPDSGVAEFDLAMPRETEGQHKVAYGLDIEGRRPVELGVYLEMADKQGRIIGKGSTIIIATPVPIEFALHQNYPNPFNPNTTILYDLPDPGPAILTIYNLLGQEVSRPVDHYHNAGYYEVNWRGNTSSGKDLPSGIYIARLMAPEYSKAIKMVLLK